jgi:hypothetical protein
MSTASDELLAALRELLADGLPAALQGGTLEASQIGSPSVDESGEWLMIPLLLVTREDDLIVDVRETEVAFGPLSAQPHARWLAFIAATLRSAGAIVESLGGPDATLPGDVFSFRQLLDDPALQRVDDFAAKLGDRAWLDAANRAFELDAWRADLEPCGLAEHAVEVEALLLPSIRLRLVEDEDDDEDEEDEDGSERDASEPARSRFGGAPDLPPDMPWPSVEGEPLTFVVQLDLAALAEFEAASELPRAGLLSCFYAPFIPDADRARNSLAHPVAVMHFPPGTPLERRPTPAGVEPLRRFALEFEHERMLPMPESPYHYEHLCPREQVEAFYASLAQGHAQHPPLDYFALSQLIVHRSECDFDRPTHRLLGHPSSIQGDPYLDVETRDDLGVYAQGEAAVMTARERALDWRLLLQVDAVQDDELLLNQDGGFFYFFLPADALAHHDWTRARGILQCH